MLPEIATLAAYSKAPGCPNLAEWLVAVEALLKAATASTTTCIASQHIDRGHTHGMCSPVALSDVLGSPAALAPRISFRCA